MNLVKGALKMKQGYNSYKKCECLDQDMTNMWNNKHFQGAINLGCGCFNIVSLCNYKKTFIEAEF